MIAGYLTDCKIAGQDPTDACNSTSRHDADLARCWSWNWSQRWMCTLSTLSLHNHLTLRWWWWSNDDGYCNQFERHCKLNDVINITCHEQSARGVASDVNVVAPMQVLYPLSIVMPVCLSPYVWLAWLWVSAATSFKRSYLMINHCSTPEMQPQKDMLQNYGQRWYGVGLYWRLWLPWSVTKDWKVEWIQCMTASANTILPCNL